MQWLALGHGRSAFIGAVAIFVVDHSSTINGFWLQHIAFPGNHHKPTLAIIKKILFNWCGECLTLLLLPYSSTSTSGLTVYLGRQTQEGPNANEVSRSVTTIVKHPSYNSNSHDNDITLLQLNSPVDFTDYIKPVCLASSNSTFFNRTVSWVTGWGNTNTGGKYLIYLTLIRVTTYCTIAIVDNILLFNVFLSFPAFIETSTGSASAYCWKQAV